MGASRPGGGPEPGLPELPVTWRPGRTRAVVYGMATAVVVASAVVAVLLPDEGGRTFGAADRAAFVGLGLVVAGLLTMLGRPKLVADADGLTVVNLVRSRRLSWPEVVHVNLRRGDPWPFLDLADGETLAVMGIQGSNGQRALVAVAQLRALLTEHSRPPRPGE